MAKVIETERLRLRPFQNSDYENMRTLESDPDVVRFTPMRVPQEPEQTRSKLESLVQRESELSPFGVWACELKESGAFVGWFMLMKTDLPFPELGFMVVQKFWGAGVASGGASALLDYAQNSLKAPGVSARTDLRNSASMHVLEKVGFQFEKVMDSKDRLTGAPIQVNLFKILF